MQKKGLILLGLIISISTLYAGKYYPYSKAFLMYQKKIWYKADKFSVKQLLDALDIHTVEQLDEYWKDGARPLAEAIEKSDKIPEKAKKVLLKYWKNGKLYKMYPLFKKVVEGYIPVSCG